MVLNCRIACFTALNVFDYFFSQAGYLTLNLNPFAYSFRFARMSSSWCQLLGRRISLSPVVRVEEVQANECADSDKDSGDRCLRSLGL